MALRSQNNDYGDRYIYSNSSNANGEPKSKYSKTQKKAKKIRVICVIGILISLLIGIVGVSFIMAYNKLDSINFVEGNEECADIVGDEYFGNLLQDPMVLNVALFGVDKRDDSEGRCRSDTTLLLTLDNRNKKIKLTSIMRDVWVEIPGYKSNRINTAISLGGEKLAVQTIQKAFGIKVDRYCTVDFESFKEIIDIIGGIDIDMTKDEAHHANRLAVELNALLVQMKKTPYEIKPIEEYTGVHHLDGVQALHYSRSRKVKTAEGVSDDYARTLRQRKVISAAIGKLKSCSLPQILKIVEKAGPYISTNLKRDEIVTLGKNSLKYMNYAIEEYRIPEDSNVKNENINGAAVLTIPDMKKARYNLAKFLYEDSIKEQN